MTFVISSISPKAIRACFLFLREYDLISKQEARELFLDEESKIIGAFKVLKIFLKASSEPPATVPCASTFSAFLACLAPIVTSFMLVFCA